ncbi:hypothetical protein ACODUO_12370 [Stenotrophomonas maltophilia]
MSYRDRSIPEGCVLGDTQLLIPKNLKYRETRSSTESFPTAEPAAPLQPPLAQRPGPSSRPSKKHACIYRAQEVDQFEQSLFGLAKSSDRRKASEALLILLKSQTPVGQREFVQVPRNFRQRLDALEAEMPNFCHVTREIRLLLTLQKAGRNQLKLPPKVRVDIRRSCYMHAGQSQEQAAR